MQTDRHADKTERESKRSGEKIIVSVGEAKVRARGTRGQNWYPAVVF